MVEYTYDAWGNCAFDPDSTTNRTLAVNNPFRYRSYYYDKDSKLYFLQSRYYDPSIGRFISSDDISYLGATGTVLSYNMFAYCENNVVNCSDPTGNALIKQFIIEKIIKTIGIWYELSDYLNEDYFIIDFVDGKKEQKAFIKIKLKKGDFKRKIENLKSVDFGITLDIITSYAIELFNKKIGRPCLFSDYCIKKEILFHMIGYLYIPSMSILRKIKISCEEVDIFEKDAYKKRDKILFDYFLGIRNCYVKTANDPYCKNIGNLKVRLPTYESESWKKSAIRY